MRKPFWQGHFIPIGCFKDITGGKSSPSPNNNQCFFRNTSITNAGELSAEKSAVVYSNMMAQDVCSLFREKLGFQEAIIDISNNIAATKIGLNAKRYDVEFNISDHFFSILSFQHPNQSSR